VEVLESTRRIDTIVLDKTGTVTTGKMRVVRFVADGEDPDVALRLVAAAERASEHPIAQAIAAAAPGPLPDVEQFVNLPGLGIEAVIEGEKVLVGRPQLLEERGFTVPETLIEAVRVAQANAQTVILAAWGDRVRAMFAVADTVKEGSTEAVQRLRDLGLDLVLLTGDTKATANAIAAELKIDTVAAEVLPQEKVDTIRRLQMEGHAVAMVGDGVNDAPALAAADLGIALGTGTDAAIEASDLTIVSGDLRAAVDAIRLSRRTLGTIKGNLFWAFAYNVAAIPLAAAGLLNPIIASATMAFSSFFVVTNSLRLRGFQPTYRGV
jgi:Cu+-exporting ATPase